MIPILTSIAGMALILLIALTLSTGRKNIRFRVVGAAFALQAGIAVIVLYIPAGKRVIEAQAPISFSAHSRTRLLAATVLRSPRCR
jgi:CNT family concentrative nucleoside transporter